MPGEQFAHGIRVVLEEEVIGRMLVAALPALQAWVNPGAHSILMAGATLTPLALIENGVHHG
jgi:hypothetical protein